MQDDLDAFLGQGEIVDEASHSKAIDAAEAEFQREADKLGLPSNGEEEVSGLNQTSLKLAPIRVVSGILGIPYAYCTFTSVNRSEYCLANFACTVFQCTQCLRIC